MTGTFLNDIALLENIITRISEPQPLNLSFLKHITDNFSENREAGSGGFGVVYRGEFKDVTIAVKRLKSSNKAEKDFEREIRSLVKVKHKNIVRFLGYCNNSEGTYMNVAQRGKPERRKFVQKQERILCFEYLSNGDLRDHIHDELRGLEWHTRYKILKDICQGVQYLHSKKMVHRDLKPENILLDNLMVPKIADLGICKLLDSGVSQSMTTSASSTFGYAAPELIDGNVSYEYDIFSLGVIITELVTGFSRTPDVKNVLTRWRHRWNKSNETLKYRQVAKCILIGKSCRSKTPQKRPTISEIIKELEDVDGGNVNAGQVNPCWNELLWVEPPELFFPFELHKKISCSLELYNEADANIAFFIETYSQFQYGVEPEKGVVPPCSHFTVKITLLAQEEAPEKMWNYKEFTVKSTRVNEGLMNEDITEAIFSKNSSNIVDKTILPVIFDAQIRAPYPLNVKKKRRATFMVEEPKELLSLESAETSFEAESSTQSARDLDNKSRVETIDVVLVYAFDCTNTTPEWNRVDNEIFWMVHERLTHYKDGCLGYAYVMSEANTCTSDMKPVDPAETYRTGYCGSSHRTRTACTKNMACGLSKAHDLIEYRGHWNSVILLFSDGMIHKGDFFDGAETFVSKVPVHTFTLGGEAYNNVLRAMAANSPGGRFHAIPITDKPRLSVPFSRTLDHILNDTNKEIHYDFHMEDPNWTHHAQIGGGLRYNNPGILPQQSKQLVDYQHSVRMTTIKAVLDQETWVAVDVPEELQAIVLSLSSTDFPVNGMEMPSTNNNSKLSEDGISTTQEPSYSTENNVDNGNVTSVTGHENRVESTSPQIENSAVGHVKSTSQTIVLGDVGYHMVNCGLLLLKMLSEYVDISKVLPSLSFEVVQRVVEILKLFNNRTCQLVLGAGAIEVSGLKSITAKHLALASQIISFIHSLIPDIRRVLLLKIPEARKQLLMSELDRVTQDYKVHRDKIHTKLVQIMRERLLANLGKLPQIVESWNGPDDTDLQPSLFAKHVTKEVTYLHRILSRILLEVDVQAIFRQIVQIFHSYITEAFSKLDLSSPQAKNRLCRDVQHILVCIRKLPAQNFSAETVRNYGLLDEFLAEKFGTKVDE